MKISARLSVRVTVFALLCFWLTATVLHAQMRVGQPSGAPDGSAALDVSGGPYSSGSAYRGLLPPKVALTQTTQATPVTAPSTGLLVYNTAQTGDVTPGYYYWEGKKWARLSTTAAGAGRVGLPGDPLPTYTYNEARALTTPPGTVFMLTEPGQEGLFRNANTPTSPADTTAPNGIRDASGTVLSSGTVMVVGGQRYKRIIDDGTINIKWFGAVGEGDAADDAPAIQRAVDYAKSLINRYGTAGYNAIVLFPPGYYRLRKPIDVTKTDGLILRGSGGRYNSTILLGETKSPAYPQGIMVDFSGSNVSGCENLTFKSDYGFSYASTVGLQFALDSRPGPTSQGGLNCIVKNCFFRLPDDPSANNGLGSIGILNCRSEEFAITDCIIQANIGCIFSYKKELNDAGLGYTISSPYTQMAPGTGSMGVINFTGNNAIQNLGKAQPALVLNGTNSVNFHGYLGRASLSGNTTNDLAILATYSTRNFQFNGTVESFSQLMRLRSEFENCTVSAVIGNTIEPTKPLIDASSAFIKGSKISIVFGDQATSTNRYILYDVGQPSNNNFPTGNVLNSEVICSQVQNNAFAISANLLKNTENTVFKTAAPFEKKTALLPIFNTPTNGISTAGWTTNIYNQIVPTGVLTSTKVYVMKVIWGKGGVDQVVQSYVLPMSGTDYNGNPAAQILPVLIPTTISWSNLGRSISIRYKAPNVVGQTSYGLEAAITTPDMSDGNLSITIAPLL